MASNRSKRILQTALGANNYNSIPRKKEKPAIEKVLNDRYERKGHCESPIPAHFEDELVQLQDLLGDVFSDENELANLANITDALNTSPEYLIEMNNSSRSKELTKKNVGFRQNPLQSSASDFTLELESSEHNVKKNSDLPIECSPPKSTEFNNGTRSSSPIAMALDSTEMCSISTKTASVSEAANTQAKEHDAVALNTPLASPIHSSHEFCNSQFCSHCSEEIDNTYAEMSDAPTPSTILSINSPFTPSTNGQRKKTYKTDKGKKRQVHKKDWQMTQRKIKKNTGKSFVNHRGKQINEKFLKDPCSTKCRLKCYNSITLEQRTKIFEKFWSLGDRSHQWKYVLKYTKRIPKRRQTTEITKHDRQYTYIYCLPNGKNETVKVCKTMFLNTISSGERIISTAWKKDQGYDIVEPDHRGKYEHKKIVIDDEMIRSVCDHVNCFPLVESHYVRKDSKKMYLEGVGSVSRMFKLYCEWVDTDKYSNRAQTKRQYRDIVNAQFNLAFHRPKKDCCDVCHAFSNIQNPSDEEKSRQEEHLAHKKLARSLKSKDKKEAMQDKTVIVATFDFQKVLTTPHGEVSIFYYKRKLTTLNFTVYDVAAKDGKCFMWHEGIAKRGSNEVSSCLYDFIQEHAQNGVKEFRFWSDNCGGQNRNRIVFAHYMLASKQFNVTITHRFLEKGHTQNEGDSVHATIEKACSRKMIYVPEEWYCLVRWAKSEGQPYTVREMATNDFYDFKSLLIGKNWTKNTSNEKMQWNRVREVRVNVEQYDRIEYKYDFGQPAKTIIVLRCGTRNVQRFSQEFDVKKAYDGPLLISYDKYKDLQDMCTSGIIPEKYHKFYKDLPHHERVQRNQRNAPLDDSD